MKNRIPKKAEKLDVTMKAYGHMICTRNHEYGNWNGVDDNGKKYYVFSSHLRNKDFCKIKVIA